MFDDIFCGSPRDKFFDIVFNANRNIVENELEKLFCEFIALKELCVQKDIDESEIASFAANNPQVIEDGLNDVFIGITGNILSQNE